MDALRLVVFSDLHLDAPFAWMGGSAPAARRRRDAQRRVLQDICHLASSRNVDALLCAGDLYEQDLFTPDTAEFIRTQFADIAPIPVFIAPGNHDWYGPDSLYAQVAWSSNVTIFNEDELTPVPLGDGVTLWGAAHRSPANTDNFLEGFRVGKPGLHLALFHGAETHGLPFQGTGKMPHAPFSELEIQPAGLRHAFVGHYHRPQASEWLTYPGNPEPLEFGEDGQRGPVVVTVSIDGAITREPIRVAKTEAHDLAVDLSGYSSRTDALDALRQLLSGLSGVARVRLTGEIPVDVDLTQSDIDSVKDGLSRLDAVRFDTSGLRAAYDFDRISEEKTVRGQFVRDVRASALSDVDRYRVLVTGLRALDGRTDLGVI